jgi:hypothetical protein
MGRLLGPEPLEDRTLPAPVGISDSTVLGSLNYVAGANQPYQAPVVVNPDPSSNPAVFQALQTIARPHGSDPVIGPASVFSQDLMNAFLAGQSVSFLITLPVISSASSGPTVLQTVNSLSLEGTLTPAGWDMTAGYPRPVFDAGFQFPGGQAPGPAFLSALQQVAQEPLADFRLIPRSSQLGNDAFFEHIDQTVSAGQQVEYMVVPELPPQFASTSNGPGEAASASSEVLEVPAATGIFSLATTTNGLRLLAPEGVTGTLEVFNEEGEEIASTNAADGLTLPDLPAGDYFVVEAPTGTAPLSLAAGPGAVPAAAGTVPATTLVSLTTTVSGPLVPILPQLPPDAGEADDSLSEVLSPESAAVGFEQPSLTSVAGPDGELEDAAAGRGFTAFQQALTSAPPAAVGPLVRTSLLPGANGLQALSAKEALARENLPSPEPGQLIPLDDLFRRVKSLAIPDSVAPPPARPATSEVLIPEWTREKVGGPAAEAPGAAGILRIPQGSASSHDDRGERGDLSVANDWPEEETFRMLAEVSLFVAGVRYARPSVFGEDVSAGGEKRRPLTIPMLPK